MVLDNVASGDYTFDGWTDEIILSTFNNKVSVPSYQCASFHTHHLTHILCCPRSHSPSLVRAFSLVLSRSLSLSLSLSSAESSTTLMDLPVSLVSAASSLLRTPIPSLWETARRKRSRSLWRREPAPHLGAKERPAAPRSQASTRARSRSATKRAEPFKATCATRVASLASSRSAR